MSLLIDMIVGVGALLAAAYCLVLSRRLRALTRLDGDVGKAIAVLSAQVDELTRVLRSAEQSSGQAGQALQGQIAQAEAAARKLELLMAAGQARPEPRAEPRAEPPADARARGEEAGGFTPYERGGARMRVMRQRDQVGAGR